MTRKSSRRALLVGSVAAMTASTCAAGKTPNDDPLLPLWKEWRETVYQEWALNDQLERISDALPPMVHCPRVLVMVGRQTGQEFWASTREEIVALLVPEAGLEPWGRRYARSKPRIDALAEELERRQAEAAAEFERSGYNAADAKLAEVCDRQNELEAAICEGGPKSAVSAAALLDLAMADQARLMPPGQYNGPWTFVSEAIRSLLPSLPEEMQSALRPAAEGFGQIVSLYRRQEVRS